MDLKHSLKKYFGYDNFRHGQEEIIISVLAGRDSMVVMPTGGGKSLCYQLPAITSKGTAIVVSPLIALMKDQVDALKRGGVAAAFINSTMSWDEIQSAFERARMGEYKLLYVAPERLESRNFIQFLSNIDISFIAIDEAHCISEWGHDFRPSYLNISSALASIKKTPIVALTATATPDVRKDIVDSLKLDNCQTFIRGFDRPNLSYFTIHSQNKAKDAFEVLKNETEGSGIVYCGSRKRVEEITASLQKFGIKRVRGYHAGMSNQLRKTTQDWFIEKENSIIVATNAFGMGIDKANVRNVIHCDLTQTLEAYYQEAGRAGRDGSPANCYLLFSYKDRNLQEFFIDCTYPDYDALVEVYDYLYDLMNVSLGQKNLSPFYIKVPHIANRLQKPTYAISSIMSLFTRQGILKKNKEMTKPSIRFIAQKAELIGYLKEHAGASSAIILEQILRSVSSEAFSKEVDLDLLKIARLTNLKQQEIEEEIRKLERNSFLKFALPAGANSYVLAKERMPDDHLPIDFHSLYLRKKNAQTKLDRVLEYAETDKCKRNFILDYFSDESYSGDCGRCSSCLDEGQKSKMKSKEKYLGGLVRNALSELGGIDMFTLADLLKGNKSQKITTEGLYKNEYFGAAKDYTFLNIRREITKHQNKYRPKPDPVLSSSFQQEEMPEMMIKLREFRSKIADKYNLLERSVLSDAAIRRIVDADINSKEDLFSVKGISKKTIALYGEKIIRIILGREEEELSDLEKSIVKMAEEQKSLDFMCNHLGLSRADLARNIQKMLEKDVNIKISYLIDNEALRVIKTYLRKNRKAALREIRSDLNIDLDYPLLRIHVALARKS